MILKGAKNLSSYLVEGLTEIGEDVSGILDADRNSDEVWEYNDFS